MVPATNELLNNSGMQFAVSVQPLALPDPEDDPVVVSKLPTACFPVYITSLAFQPATEKRRPTSALKHGGCAIICHTVKANTGRHCRHLSAAGAT
jgi:hypothetical protein